MRWFRYGPLAALGLLMAACSEGDAVGTVVPAITTLAADSASNPTVAWAGGEGGYAAWVGREDGQSAVFVAALGADGGVGPAVRANDIPGDAAPHLQAPAQVAVGPDGAVYVLWQNNTPVAGRRFPASDLRLAVSTDGGQSFRPAVTVNDDAGGPPTSHTFHDIIVAPDGTVYVTWIDSRERDAIAHQRLHEGAGHMHHGDHGSMSEMMAVAMSHDHGDADLPAGPEIRIARSTDGGVTFEPSVVVDSVACPCCRTSVALGPDGSVYVAWRKIYPGDVRDVVVARAEAGTLRFEEPVRVHQDDWVFPGCPHAGPSLAFDAEGRLLAGWYTGREGRQGLWYAVSTDGGRSFGDPSPVLTGEWVPPAQLRLAGAEGRVWAVWDDRTTDAPTIRVAGAPVGQPLQTIDGWAVPGGDPAITAAGEDAVVAWLDGTTANMAIVRRARGQ